MSKRCKNCRLWKRFQGDEPTTPGRSSKACTLRLHVVERPLGPVQVPSMVPGHEMGPHFGVRTDPNFSCTFFAAKKLPFVKPKD